MSSEKKAKDLEVELYSSLDLQLSTALYSSLQLSTALPEYSTILRVHLAEYRTGIWYRLVPGTVEVLSRYCSDPVLRFAVAIATAIFPTCDMALRLHWYALYIYVSKV